MLTATIAKTKNELSKYLGMVKAGQSILILDRNHPVACLRPVRGDSGSGGDDGKLLKLEASGVIRSPVANPDWSPLLDEPLPEAGGGCSALRTLLEEREAGG